MEDHYTDYVSHIEVCTDTSADRSHPLLQMTKHLRKAPSLHNIHIEKNEQIPVHTDPIPLLQLTVDLCNTTTPKQLCI